MTKIIDGKAIAARIRQEIREEIEALRTEDSLPGLAVVLVGEDPASQVYVRMKTRACQEVGIRTETRRLPEQTSQQELLRVIDDLNRDSRYHGILVQLPLPAHINTLTVLEAVAPQKDVDCFHPYNVGRLMIGEPIFQPATPAGILELLRRSDIDPAGKHVVVLGRSNIVGKPVAMMLAQKKTGANALVTLVHSAAKDVSPFTRQADILIAAVGRPEFVKADMVKEGVVVIDVGVNSVPADNEKGYRLVGDVVFAEVSRKAAAITPVPGGVGPMTIAMLLKNTLFAWKRVKQFS